MGAFQIAAGHRPAFAGRQAQAAADYTLPASHGPVWSLTISIRKILKNINSFL